MSRLMGEGSSRGHSGQDSGQGPSLISRRPAEDRCRQWLQVQGRAQPLKDQAWQSASQTNHSGYGVGSGSRAHLEWC